MRDGWIERKDIERQTEIHWDKEIDRNRYIDSSPATQQQKETAAN